MQYSLPIFAIGTFISLVGIHLRAVRLEERMCSTQYKIMNMEKHIDMLSKKDEQEKIERLRKENSELERILNTK